MIFFSFSDQTIGSLCVFWVKQMQIIFCFVKNLKMLYELLVRFKSFFAFGRTQNIVSVVDQMQMIFRFWENLKRLYYIVEKRKKNGVWAFCCVYNNSCVDFTMMIPHHYQQLPFFPQRFPIRFHFRFQLTSTPDSRFPVRFQLTPIPDPRFHVRFQLTPIPDPRFHVGF